ncbi:teichoic acid biosynthesis protein A [Lactobacillus selangorensis]|uniref:N-acetylglucosaminyldiphosphoundecaprenol N-acetyl-beta-D-mannosaminyltransferase n=2 Tax=Lactobacillus selangorensis TaxID=81857 RepID=A0A0R2FY94_9LACO|nr:teichoic acid biosynthesis protein A [Lactobacillus selangorensis]KRN29860.1 teichoic acid biosynthesis protein A [Lactobacillus selangorensis]
MSFPTVTVLGVPFIKATNAQFLNQLYQDLKQHKNRFVVTANPEIVMYARDHHDYLNTVLTADYITPDGIGIIQGAKILKQPLPERVTGYDTMLALFKFANAHHLKVYLLGAKPEVIHAVLHKLTVEYPHLEIVGAHDGYFKDDSDILNTIHAKQPDLVFVATGFPKQEEWIARNRYLSDSVWMGVGGSFDVFAGAVKRAPKIFQTLHLEWFYRLLQEPSRYKRMLVLPKYLGLVKKEAKRN